MMLESYSNSNESDNVLFLYCWKKTVRCPHRDTTMLLLMTM